MRSIAQVARSIAQDPAERFDAQRALAHSWLCDLALGGNGATSSSSPPRACASPGAAAQGELGPEVVGASGACRGVAPGETQGMQACIMRLLAIESPPWPSHYPTQSGSASGALTQTAHPERPGAKRRRGDPMPMKPFGSCCQRRRPPPCAAIGPTASVSTEIRMHSVRAIRNPQATRSAPDQTAPRPPQHLARTQKRMSAMRVAHGQPEV